MEHCLFSHSKLEQIKEVQSKDQALAQCGDWLRKNLPRVKLNPITSTAEAVKNCNLKDGIAAIAGELAGRINEVPLLAKGIQDKKKMSQDFWLSPEMLCRHFRSSLSH